MRPTINLFLAIIFGSFLINSLSAKESSTPAADPCDLDITIPLDIHLCDGDDFDICGSITSSLSDIEFVWLEDGAPTGLDLCDFVSVDGNTTFTLQVTGINENNLIFNGDFESGGPSTTDYQAEPGGGCTHGAGFLGCEGTYAILDDPSQGHTNFDDCGFDGNMMVVNGAPSLQNIWCQEVCVDPDGTYDFTAWAASVNGSSPAILQFSIDGELIGSEFGLSGTTCVWEQFEAEWSPMNGETTVEICVTNQNTAAGGNDFALDNIEFYQTCTKEESFEVTVSQLDIIANDPDPITCLNEQTYIEITIDSPNDYVSVEWTTDDGDILDVLSGDLTMIAGSAGLYKVVVVDEFGCPFSEEFYVDDYSFIPSVDIFANGILNCTQTEVLLTTITDADDPEYDWRDEDGNFLGDDEEYLATQPGEYFLVVTDQDNGCTAEQVIEVEEEIEIPDFVLAASNDLNCMLGSAIISTSEPYQNVNWSTIPAAPISTVSGTNDTITVSQAGTYVATVNLAGCIHTDTIVIDEVFPDFDYSAMQEAMVIDCNNPGSDVFINFDPNLFTIQWQNSFGTSSTVELTQAGTYFYTLSDSIGCTTLDSVVVAESFSEPMVFADATEIDCGETEATVTIGWASNDLLISEVNWTLPDGSIFIGSTQIIVTQPGVVGYTAISNNNGCGTSGTIEVIATGDFPEISTTGTTLDCNNLDGTISAANPSGNQDTYLWTFPDGTTEAGATVTTSQEGSHLVVATAMNGCQSTMNVMVIGDFEEPSIEDIPDVILDCNNSSVSITTDSATAESYKWSGPGGDSTVPDYLVTIPGNYSLEIKAANGCTATTEFLVTLDTIAPAVSFSAPQVLDCDLTSFAPIASTLSSIADIIWTSPTGEILSDPVEIRQGGLYQIEVTGTNGCITYYDYAVEQNIELPEFTLEATTITCSETTSLITLMTTDNLQEIEYQRAGIALGLGTEIIVDGPGEVTVIVTDEKGCISYSSIAPPVDTLGLDFNISAGELGCQVDGVLIELDTVVDYVSTQIYDNNQDLLGDLTTSITEPGSYSVNLIANNGCESAEVIEIISDDSTVDFVLDPVTLDCNNRDVDIPVLTLDEYDSAVIFNENGTTLDAADFPDALSVSEEGTMTVIVTNTNGCTSEQTIEVSLDVAEVDFEIESGDLDCNVTETIVEIMTNESFVTAILMDENDNEVAQLDTGSEFSGITEGGTYSVVITGANGCESIRTTTIDMDTTLAQLDLTSGLMNCNGAAVPITVVTDLPAVTGGTGTIGSVVGPSGNEQLISGDFEVDAIGLYTVAIVAPNGCKTIETVEVMENPDQLDFSVFDAETLTCDGAGFLSNLDISGGAGPYEVSIDGEFTSGAGPYEVEGFGSHDLSIIDANGCRLDTLFIIEEVPEVSAYIIPEIEVIAGEELTLELELNQDEEEVIISWIPQEGLSCYDCLRPEFIGTEDITYTITVIDKYGCAAETQLRIDVEGIPSIYVPNVMDFNGSGDDNRFTIYTGKNHLEEIISLQIYDRWGNKVFLNESFQPNEPSEGWDGYYKDSPVNQGVYTYYALVKYLDGTEEKLFGDLTLLR